MIRGQHSGSIPSITFSNAQQALDPANRINKSKASITHPSNRNLAARHFSTSNPFIPWALSTGHADPDGIPCAMPLDLKYSTGNLEVRSALLGARIRRDEWSCRRMSASKNEAQEDLVNTDQMIVLYKFGDLACIHRTTSSTVHGEQVS